MYCSGSSLGKICYTTPEEARRNITRRRKEGKRMRSYYCKDCRSWHLTSK